MTENDIEEINGNKLREFLMNLKPFIGCRFVTKWNPKLSPIKETGMLDGNVKIVHLTSESSSESSFGKLFFWRLKIGKKHKRKKPAEKPRGENSQDSSKYLVKSKVCSPNMDKMENAQNPTYSASTSNRQVPMEPANNDIAESSSDFKTKDNANGNGTNLVVNGSRFKTLSFNGKRENINCNGVNDENVKKLGLILSCLQDIHDQMILISKKQDDIKKQLKANSMTSTNIKAVRNEICQYVESNLKVTTGKDTEESYKNLDTKIENKFCEVDKKLAEIVANQYQKDPNVLSNELTTLMKPIVDKEFKDLYNSTVVPKTDKALKCMIEQIDGAVKERSSYYKEEWNSFVNKIKVDRDIALRNDTNTHLIQKFFDVVKKSEEMVLKSYDSLLKQLTEQIDKETGVIDDIKRSIERNDIAKAFNTALLALDTELVIFVCSHVNTPLDELFQSPSMEPPIILSLMQQLSFDLSNNTGIKHKYLQAAVGNVTSTNNRYKKSFKSVLMHIDREIETFLSQDPQNPFCCKIEALQLSVKIKIDLLT